MAVIKILKSFRNVAMVVSPQILKNPAISYLDILPSMAIMSFR